MFDIDGTLTPPLEKMSFSSVAGFLSWVEDKKVYLVGGSDKQKIDKQLPNSVQRRCEGIFCCMGNELWQNGEVVYQNEFDPPIDLREMLVSFQMHTSFPVRVKIGGRGAVFEFRTGMLNFTTIGRNATPEERLKYYEWDKEKGERRHIATEVERLFPDLEVRIGGQISVDIQPKGSNKSQASKWIRNKVDKDITFIGDKCEKGGNDHDIYVDVLGGGGRAFSVSGVKETMDIINSNYL